MRWAAVLIVVTAWIYGPMVDAPFVYEDRSWIGAVGPKDTFDVIRWPGRVVTQATYRWQAIEGVSVARALHLGNVALHLLCGAFVFGVARRLGLSRDGAWCASAIFLWHPLNVAAVAYVSARSDLLMTLWSLVAVWCALRKTWWAVPIVLAACLLAGGSKELGAVSIALVLWTWKPRIVWHGLWLVPLVALVVRWEQYGIRAWPDAVTWVELASGQVMAIWRVLWLLVIPVGFSIDPDPWFWHLPERIVGFWTLVGVTVFAWRKHTPLLRWALGWVAIVLLPRVVMPTYEPVHDQHAYLAVAGVSVLVGLWFGGDQTWDDAFSPS